MKMVSPLNKNGADIKGIAPEGISAGGVVQASADGSKITYLSQGSFAGENREDPAASPEPQSSPVGSQYLSGREGSGTGWSTQNITTPGNSATYSAVGAGAPYRAFSADLGLGLELNGEAGGQVVGNPPLAGAPAGYQNFYLRDNNDDILQPLLSIEPAQPAEKFLMGLEAVSPDLQHIVVNSTGALTPGASQGEGER
jgi:hypothetical protein